MGLGVKRAREKAGLSAAKLEAKTRELGYPITRGTIAKIEGGHRDGKFDVTEVVILATALGVAPLDIVFPPTPAPVEYLPGQSTTTGHALAIFANSTALELERMRGAMLQVFDERYEKFLQKWAGWEQEDNHSLEDKWELDGLILSLGSTAESIQRNWTEQRDLGMVEGDDPRAPDYEPAIENMRERRELRDQRALRDG